MDSKSTPSYLAHLAWIIPSAIALIGIVLDHMDMAGLLFWKIWNIFFVNIWYLWIAAASYGLYRFVRLIQNLHNLTNEEIPALKTAHDETRSRIKELFEGEAKSRVAATDTLSDRINRLDTQSRKDLTESLTAARSQLTDLVKKEAHERTEGIAAIGRRIDSEFERMNNIETTLPAQITALKKRVDKVESPPALNMEMLKEIINSSPRVSTPETLPGALGLLASPHIPSPVEAISGMGLGLINSIPRVPTKEELLADAVKKRAKKT